MDSTGKARREYSVNQLISEIEEADRDLGIQTIIITGPEEGPEAITDEESNESDGEVEGDTIHLPRRILDAEGELDTLMQAEEECIEEIHQPSTSRVNRRSRATQKLSGTPKKWSRGMKNANFRIPDFVSHDLPASFSKNQSPFQSFQVFFCIELCNLIVDQTNLYAHSRGNHTFNVSFEEIYSLIGILLFSGYHVLPRRRMYWNTDKDFDIKIVQNTCKRNRFDEILRYLHLADNSKMDVSDRLYKVRPLFDHLNAKFKLLPPDRDCSVDESIIPYYGRHGAKQFIRGKPIRFGFKLWCLAESNGYLIQAEPYAGSCTRLQKTTLGLGGDTVVGLLEKGKIKKGARLFFDNFFTSERLLECLREKGVGGSGTLRENRINYKSYQLKEKSLFRKSPRGTIEEISNGNLAIVTME
ncbi:hypothetical protein J437_LFUL012918 [Ladona fulva]|uniref:PiggyBac transposable element-derived protein domain-containing protein n=1 Tax=Ladona fulva TaxID=123851 RepID=A0A8K0KDM5_LADFU|nr:hypothetical protein J437_LFUL012918 [Ladona fulva]